MVAGDTEVVAVHAYKAQHTDELTLEKGDEIVLTRRPDHQVPVDNADMGPDDALEQQQEAEASWWEGTRRRDGVTGWFPANHVKIMPKEATSKASTASNGDQAANAALTREPTSELSYERVVVSQILESESQFCERLRTIKSLFLDHLPSTVRKSLSVDIFSSLVDIHERLVEKLLQSPRRIGGCLLEEAATIADVQRQYSMRHPSIVKFLRAERNQATVKSICELTESSLRKTFESSAPPAAAKHQQPLAVLLATVGLSPSDINGADVPMPQERCVLILTAALSEPIRHLETYAPLLRELQRHLHVAHADRGDTQHAGGFFADVGERCRALRRRETTKLELIDECVAQSGDAAGRRAPDVVGHVKVVSALSREFVDAVLASAAVFDPSGDVTTTVPAPEVIDLKHPPEDRLLAMYDQGKSDETVVVLAPPNDKGTKYTSEFVVSTRRHFVAPQKLLNSQTLLHSFCLVFVSSGGENQYQAVLVVCPSSADRQEWLSVLSSSAECPSGVALRQSIQASKPGKPSTLTAADASAKIRQYSTGNASGSLNSNQRKSDCATDSPRAIDNTSLELIKRAGAVLGVPLAPCVRPTAPPPATSQRSIDDDQALLMLLDSYCSTNGTLGHPLDHTRATNYCTLPRRQQQQPQHRRFFDTSSSPHRVEPTRARPHRTVSPPSLTGGRATMTHQGRLKSGSTPTASLVQSFRRRRFFFSKQRFSSSMDATTNSQMDGSPSRNHQQRNGSAKPRAEFDPRSEKLLIEDEGGLLKEKTLVDTVYDLASTVLTLKSEVARLNAKLESK